MVQEEMGTGQCYQPLPALPAAAAVTGRLAKGTPTEAAAAAAGRLVKLTPTEAGAAGRLAHSTLTEALAVAGRLAHLPSTEAAAGCRTLTCKDTPLPTHDTVDGNTVKLKKPLVLRYYNPSQKYFTIR
jgi:hypothetical protein